MTDPLALPAGWPALSVAEIRARLTAPGAPFETEAITVGGTPRRVWKNGPKTLVEVFLAARAHGERTFLVYEDERASYAAFAKASIMLAHDLVARGVAKGDHVAIVMRNLPEWPVALFASLLAGAIAVPLNAWWTGDELEFGLTDCGASVAIVDAERFERLRPHLAACKELRQVLVTRAGDGAIDVPAPIAAAHLGAIIGPASGWPALAERPLPDITVLPEDGSTILFTSGTTGRPKGALASHRAGTCYVLGAGYVQARGFMRRGEPVPAPDPAVQKAVLLAVPFFHTTGAHAIMFPAMAGGAKLVLMRRWDAETGMQLIERERVTSAGGVPTIAWQIIEHPARGKYDLTSLESVSYGGAPAASELVRRIKTEFPKSAPAIGWGMTETSGGVASHSGEDYINRPDSSGPCLPVAELAVLDDDWQQLATGSIGELAVRGQGVIAGYWRLPEVNAQLFRDGWFRTGDLARLDEEGFLYVVDRKKDMLIRGGENIYCIEVEDALYKHPAVMDAAVLGIPHKTLGEQPAAIVTLKPGAEAGEAELQAFVAARLAAYKVPVRVLLRHEPLPRNANGKIIKREMKALFG